ncbi:hypothetical protein D3C86_1697270 [compost metagenome]
MMGNAFQALGHSGSGLGIGIQRLQIALACIRIVDHGSQRLVDFVGDPRGQFTESDQPCGVCQFVLMTALLHFPQLALGHVARDQ